MDNLVLTGALYGLIAFIQLYYGCRVTAWVFGKFFVSRKRHKQALTKRYKLERKCEMHEADIKRLKAALPDNVHIVTGTASPDDGWRRGGIPMHGLFEEFLRPTLDGMEAKKPAPYGSKLPDKPDYSDAAQTEFRKRRTAFEVLDVMGFVWDGRSAWIVPQKADQ